MDYDYTCEDCGHDFDYEDGHKSHGLIEWVECPNCRKTVHDDKL